MSRNRLLERRYAFGLAVVFDSDVYVVKVLIMKVRNEKSHQLNEVN